jgi:hypothetical protein
VSRYDAVDYLLVGIEMAGLHASQRAYVYGSEELTRYFAALADSWRGWEGVREFSSVERDFELRAYHDGVGHCVVEVRLGISPPREWGDRRLGCRRCGRR